MEALSPTSVVAASSVLAGWPAPQGQKQRHKPEPEQPPVRHVYGPLVWPAGARDTPRSRRQQRVRQATSCGCDTGGTAARCSEPGWRWRELT